MAEADAPAYPTDFVEPWTFSDVVLVVEDQKFHVHRSILAIWSPVFKKMFTSEFKEYHCLMIKILERIDDFIRT